MRTRLLAMTALLGLVVAIAPIATARAAAPGWTPESRWSANDDWEPTIAADPSSNWVYQATTRYGGPKACSSCPGTAIIFRASSDGGATWGADRFICTCRNVKAQADPVLAVSTTGVVYAVF